MLNCTNISHNQINCLAAELPLTQWCATCKSVIEKPNKPQRKKPQLSPELKRFLSLKLPSHTGTSPESEYHRVMGRWPDRTRDVDVTLEHDGQVIHCNDPVGLKTAASYLKQLSL